MAQPIKCKLTASEVVRVYEQIVAGETIRKIGRDFGVSHETVNLIAKGKTYKWAYPVFEHLAAEAGYDVNAPYRGVKRLDETTVYSYYSAHVVAGAAPAEIAKAADVSEGYMRAILRGDAYPEYHHLYEQLVAEYGEPQKRRDPRCKLTDDEVMEIYRMVAAGQSQAEAARKFKVDQMTVSTLIRGRGYKHLYHHFEAMEKQPRPRIPRGRMFSAKQIAKIHRKHRKGKPVAAIARKHGVTARIIQNILAGKSYAELHPDRIGKNPE